MMMNFGKSPAVGRTASKLARAVAGKTDSVSVVARNVHLSTMSGLGASQLATKLAASHMVTRVPVVTLPSRQMSGKGDIAGVEEATKLWTNTVTLNTEDAPEKTAALYADNALFWGTVSEQVRSTPQHFYDYFDFFARLPKLSLVAYDPEPPVVHGDFAVHAGAYTFAWEVDGKMKETRARFTFSYRLKDGKWTIVEHHSSAMPTAPEALKPVPAQ